MAWLKNMLARNEEENELTPLKGGNEVMETSEEEGQLAVDVFQDKDNVYVKSTIAGVKPEDLDVTLSSNEVTISGERKQEEEVKEADYIYQECYWGGFSRTVALPTQEVDIEKAKANMDNGVLTIRIPRVVKVKSRKLKIASKSKTSQEE